MYYTIKRGDTVSRIAAKYNVPISSILALNPQIKRPDQIFVGQVLLIPNIEDLPQNAEFDLPVSPSELVAKARSVLGGNIKYELGRGGMHPSDPLPTRDNLCDCSGFVCWVIGLSRKTTVPFYKQFGGWIFTDSMVADINSDAGIFEWLQFPEEGCLVVYGAGNKIGHCGIVSQAASGVMKKVIHCSSGNSTKYNAAIQETAPNVFNRSDTVWGRFVG